jgi:hypothetical protein
MRSRRYVPPWEKHCGCPKCGAKPGQQCRTVTSTAPHYSRPGCATSAHLARIKLYEHLFKGGSR